MRLELAYVTPRRGRLKSSHAQALVDDFLHRSARYAPTQAVSFATEADLLAQYAGAAARSAALILLDSRGKSLASEAVAEWIGRMRDTGTPQIVFAVGPADGWSEAAWKRAALHLAFGGITLPHELALVVAAEQIYRVLTILAGHPYHGGHA